MTNQNLENNTQREFSFMEEPKKTSKKKIIGWTLGGVLVGAMVLGSSYAYKTIQDLNGIGKGYQRLYELEIGFAKEVTKGLLENE